MYKVNFIPLLLLFIGFSFLVITILGDTTLLGNYTNTDPRDWEKFSPDLVDEIQDADSFLQEILIRNPDFYQSTKMEKAISLHNLVSERFTSGHARHNVFSNWVLFLLGQAHPSFRSVFNVDLLIKNGHSLICSQHSYVLMCLAIKSGLRARHVGLNGHVVSEIYWDGRWHMFDPSMELYALDNSGEVVSVSNLEQNPELVNALYPASRSNLAETFLSAEDNSFNAHPLGVYFEWKSQVLMYVERCSSVLKYIFPLMLILFGIWRLFRNNSGKQKMSSVDLSK